MKKLCSIAFATLMLFSCGGKPSEGVSGSQNNNSSGQSATQYNRKETIYIGGALWASPTNFNPISPTQEPGVISALYLTLFENDLLQDKLVPSLAKSGDWTSANTYRLSLQDNAVWSDGKPISADDVIYTFFDLPKKISLQHSDLANQSLSSINKIDEKTVDFVFSNPSYPDFKEYLYKIAVVPKHVFETFSDVSKELNAKPVTSGPFGLETALEDKMVFKRIDGWWGESTLGLSFKMSRIVYLKSGSNADSLNLLLQGESLDFSGNYLGSIGTVLKKAPHLHTWYESAPYMLPDSTVFLFINTTKPNLNDINLRKAMSYAINIDTIVNRVYDNMVVKSEASGILPLQSHKKYYDESVGLAKGPTYDVEKAKSILTSAGYIDKDGDGLVEDPKGQKMQFKIIVPAGWSDWMESIRSISADLKAVGIDAQADFPDFNKYNEELINSKYDLAINNFGARITNSIWSFWYWLLAPLEQNALTGNISRFSSPEAIASLNKIKTTSQDDVDTIKAEVNKIVGVALDNAPFIPLWYNAAWYTYNDKYWTGWPSEFNKDNQNFPSVWAAYWTSGGLRMLSKISPK